MKINPLALAVIAVISLLAIGCLGGGGSMSGGTTGATTTNGSTNGATNGGGGGGVVVNVDMNGMIFTPQVVNAHAGDTVRWTNSGSLPHTVTSDTGETGLDSSSQFPSGIGQNGVFNWTVPAGATVGTHYFYHCQFHGSAGNGAALGNGMSGEITVN